MKELMQEVMSQPEPIVASIEEINGAYDEVEKQADTLDTLVEVTASLESLLTEDHDTSSVMYSHALEALARRVYLPCDEIHAAVESADKKDNLLKRMYEAIKKALVKMYNAVKDFFKRIVSGVAGLFRRKEKLVEDAKASNNIDWQKACGELKESYDKLIKEVRSNSKKTEELSISNAVAKAEIYNTQDLKTATNTIQRLQDQLAELTKRSNELSATNKQMEKEIKETLAVSDDTRRGYDKVMLTVEDIDTALKRVDELVKASEKHAKDSAEALKIANHNADSAKMRFVESATRMKDRSLTAAAKFEATVARDLLKMSESAVK